MQYITVYSILTDSARIPWIHLFSGLVIFPIFMYAVWRKGPRVMLWPLLGWGLVWNGITIPCSWHMQSAHVEAQNLLRSGQCQEVAGPIEQFAPMPYGGHAQESFFVKGVHFDYSDSNNSKPGYNKSESHGGVLHKGISVRLKYHKDSILQIEVPKVEDASVKQSH